MNAGLLPLATCRKRSGLCQLPTALKVASTFSMLEPGWEALRGSLKGLSRIGVQVGVVDTAFLQVLRTRTGLGDEGYRLEIGKKSILLSAESEEGAFYGLHTLASLITEHGRNLPCVMIEDKPELKRRGFYLDCARGKVPTLDTVKALIRKMASWKMNELQLYIENTFTFQKHPKVGRGFSPYTPKDILEIQACCREHFIRFVPSLTSFGHFERILTLPEYQHLGEKPGLWGFPGGTTLDCSNPKSLELVADLYSEFLPLFESPWFNACCDETWELGKGKNEAKVKRRGVAPVYLDFIKKLYTLCGEHGKQMHIWSDIVLNHPECIPKVPKDIVMLNWDYSVDGARIPLSPKFQEAGLDWIACPGSNGWVSHGTRLTDGLGSVRVFAKEAKKSGACGLLHTDWGDYGHRNTLGVSLCSLAYAAAQAWAPGKVPEKGFVERFCQDQVSSTQAKKVAEHLQVIGHLEDRVGVQVIYRAFTAGLRPNSDFHKGMSPRSPVYRPSIWRGHPLELAKVKNLPDAVSDLAALEPLTVEGDAWTRHFLDDVNLAVAMDYVACEHLDLTVQWRNGARISAGRKKGFITRYAGMIKHFETNWHKRNRPSRVMDNVRLLNRGFEEWRTL